MVSGDIEPSCDCEGRARKLFADHGNAAYVQQYEHWARDGQGRAGEDAQVHDNNGLDEREGTGRNRLSQTHGHYQNETDRLRIWNIARASLCLYIYSRRILSFDMFEKVARQAEALWPLIRRLC